MPQRWSSDVIPSAAECVRIEMLDALDRVWRKLNDLEQRLRLLEEAQDEEAEETSG